MHTSKYASLAKCSNATALRDIRDMVVRGLLVKNPGIGRSTPCRLLTLAELKDPEHEPGRRCVSCKVNSCLRCYCGAWAALPCSAEPLSVAVSGSSLLSRRRIKRHPYSL